MSIVDHWEDADEHPPDPVTSEEAAHVLVDLVQAGELALEDIADVSTRSRVQDLLRRP